MSSGLVNGSLAVVPVPLTVKVCERVIPDRIVNAVSAAWGEGWSPPAGATAGSSGNGERCQSGDGKRRRRTGG